MRHGHHSRGCGPHGLRRGRFPSREEWLRALEERQRDLEQETADIADLIRRLREEQPKPETTEV
jgi:hypothetical protein